MQAGVIILKVGKIVDVDEETSVIDSTNLFL